MEGALRRISEDIINYEHDEVVKSCRGALDLIAKKNNIPSREELIKLYR